MRSSSSRSVVKQTLNSPGRARRALSAASRAAASALAQQAYEAANVQMPELATMSRSDFLAHFRGLSLDQSSENRSEKNHIIENNNVMNHYVLHAQWFVISYRLVSHVSILELYAVICTLIFHSPQKMGVRLFAKRKKR